MEETWCQNSFSDFVESSDEPELDEVAEPTFQYSQGLYYPIYIGEVLAQRYRIVHKLGYGGFSTVWSALDMQHNQHSQVEAKHPFVALKIHIPGTNGEYEGAMNNEIRRSSPKDSNLLTCFDMFYLGGLQGNIHVRHLVLVFSLQGPNLYSCLYRAPLETHMSAMRHVLQGLAHLHSTGIVHRGINKLDDCKDVDTLYKYIGRPKIFPLEAWKPGQLVKPMHVPRCSIGRTGYIGDFGIAIRAGTSVHPKMHAPIRYCAPELLHGMDPTFASDMWSYMVVFAEVCLSFNPFLGARNNCAQLLNCMVNMLGPLPAAWKGLYFDRDQSDDSWYDQSRSPDPEQSLEEKMQRSRNAETLYDQPKVRQIIRKGFSYLPEDRPAAAQLFYDSDFCSVMSHYHS